jgi:hypothetical protein
MREMKPFASLSSGLLARKGAAKPAMRPQAFGTFGASLDDLGWDDMGEPNQHEEQQPVTPVCGLTPAPRSAPEPEVVVQQRALEESFAPVERESDAPAVEESFAPARVVKLPRRRGEASSAKAKAAFTLRLDPERHLKLRLACALTGRSAQHLVTGALDEFLNTLPEVEALATSASAQAGKRSR